jgi:TRAP-type C4-dicarboxylate transport system permease small subunit
VKRLGDGIGGVLLLTGATGLIGAMLIDGIAVIGRHVGIPFTGSIELVQAFIVLGAASAIAYASMGATHAAVDLVFHRLPVSAQHLAHRLAALLGFLFLAALMTGSAWIAWEYRDAGERTELLGIELKWLRLYWLACAVIAAAAMLAPLFAKKLPPDPALNDPAPGEGD